MPWFARDIREAAMPEGAMMSSENERSGSERKTPATGIVIHMRVEPMPRPRVSAFIWGGKVRPMPSLPYGRRSA